VIPVVIPVRSNNIAPQRCTIGMRNYHWHMIASNHNSASESSTLTQHETHHPESCLGNLAEGVSKVKSCFLAVISPTAFTTRPMDRQTNDDVVRRRNLPLKFHEDWHRFLAKIRRIAPIPTFPPSVETTHKPALRLSVSPSRTGTRFGVANKSNQPWNLPSRI
jgi:hypothetical protein